MNKTAILRNNPRKYNRQEEKKIWVISSVQCKEKSINKTPRDNEFRAEVNYTKWRVKVEP
jgi:hypothetical protein